MRWLKSTSPDAYRASLEQLAGYKAKALADGISATNAETLVARLTARMRGGTEPEWLTLTFNRIYSSGDERLSRTPNAFLVETVKGLRPGKALDIGMGEG